MRRTRIREHLRGDLRVAVSARVSGSFLPGPMGFGWVAHCFWFIRRSKSNLVTPPLPVRKDNSRVMRGRALRWAVLPSRLAAVR